MRKGKGKAVFISALVAMAVCAAVAIAGVIVFYAKATESYVLPLTLSLGGLGGVILCMIVAFTAIPKNRQSEQEEELKNGGNGDDKSN